MLRENDLEMKVKSFEADRSFSFEVDYLCTAIKVYTSTFTNLWYGPWKVEPEDKVAANYFHCYSLTRTILHSLKRR